MSIERNPSISRRDFVRQAGLLAGTALGAGASAIEAAESAAAAPPAAAPGEVPCRVLGRTGVRLPMFTMGTAPCGSFPPSKIAELVNAALDEGVTVIDTSEKYVNSQEGVGLALGKRRKDVFLSTKVFANTIAEAEESLARSIKLLRTDHFDLLCYHSLGNLKIDRAMEPDGVFTWLVKQKKAGKCRYLGISGHNLPARFPQFLQTGDVDVLLAAVNFVDRHTYNFEEEVLPVARKHGVGVIAMKVFGGAAGGEYKNPTGPHIDRKHVPAALRYALSLPGVVSANLGVHSVEQVRGNIRMIKDFRPLAPDENAALLALGKDMAAKWGEHFGPVKEKKTA